MRHGELGRLLGLLPLLVMKEAEGELGEEEEEDNDAEDLMGATELAGLEGAMISLSSQIKTDR